MRIHPEDEINKAIDKAINCYCSDGLGHGLSGCNLAIIRDAIEELFALRFKFRAEKAIVRLLKSRLADLSGDKPEENDSSPVR